MAKAQKFIIIPEPKQIWGGNGNHAALVTGVSASRMISFKRHDVEGLSGVLTLDTFNMLFPHHMASSVE